MPQGDSANLFHRRVEARSGEARAAIAPALRVYRALQKGDATGVDFSYEFAFCLYVQAITCDEAASHAERSAALDEAARLLTPLIDEARALRDIRELIELIAVEHAKREEKS